MAKLLNSDKSPRSLSIQRPFMIFVAATMVAVISVVWYMVGSNRYETILSQSSTPVGSSVTFSQSDAETTLSGLYEDRGGDVLIARLNLNDSAHEALPYRGSDYTVFVQSDALGGFEEIPILFGKVGTDGDLILILPKPTDEVYTFVLANMTYQSNAALDAMEPGGSGQNYSLDPEESVVSALSQFEEGASSGETQDFESSAQESGSMHDLAAFRVTTDPSLDEPAYQPQTINEDLFDEQSGQFDFETFFESVYVETAVDNLTSEYNSLETQANQYESVLEDLTTRLNSNPNDEAASTRLRDARSALENIEESQQGIADDLTTYETLDFDSSMFQNFQESAVVIEN